MRLFFTLGISFFLSLSSSAVAQTQYRGLDNLPLGAATLSTGGGNLTVSNIGSSGKDGVSIDIGQSEGAAVEWVPLAPPSSLLDGTALIFSAVGTISGNPGQSLGNLQLVDAGATCQITPDFSPLGATTARVELYNQGVHVVTVSGHSGPIQADLFPVVCDKGGARIPIPLPPFPPGGPPWSRLACFVIIWEQPTPITIPGQAPANADEMRLLIESNPGFLESINTLDLRITDPSGTPSQFTITDEALGMFGHPLRGLGQATFQAGGDHLIVSNIGSSGQDGVSIDLGDLELGAELLWAPLNPNADPLNPNLQLHVEAFGTVGGLPNRLFGSTTIAPLPAGPLSVTADYSPIGSSTQLLEILLDGQVVFTQSGTTGGVEVPDLPSGCGKRAVPPGTPGVTPVLCFAWRWSPPTQITVPGGPTIQGDEVRLLSEEPTFTYDHLCRIFYASRDLPQGQIDLLGIPNALRGVEPQGWPFVQTLGTSDSHRNTGCTDCLVISNIGSSGCDGVSIDLGPNVETFRTDFAPLGASADHPPPALLQFQARGQVTAGPPGQLLGSLTFQNSAAAIQVSTDYSPIGPTQIRLRLFNNGALVHESTVADGFLFDVPVWPRGCGKEPATLPGLGGGTTLCFWIDPDEDTPVTFPGSGKAGSTTIPADFIQVLAETPSAPLESLSNWTLLASDIPFILLTGVGDVPAPSAVDGPIAGSPRLFLQPIRPNPFGFGARASVVFHMERDGRATARVFALNGRLVRTLHDGSLPLGPHSLSWDGQDDHGRRLPAGIYFIRLQAPGQTGSRKVALIP